MTVQVYPGADGAFTLYEDDGLTFDDKRGDWTGIEMRWNDSNRRLTPRLAKGSRMRPPAARHINVRLSGTQTVRDVVFSGAATEVRF